MKNCVLINCNDDYVSKAIVALCQFNSYNQDFDKVIIGTKFSDIKKKLCLSYNIQILEIDLSNDFKNINKRPYGTQYPIECFYHFYASNF